MHYVTKSNIHFHAQRAGYKCPHNLSIVHVAAGQRMGVDGSIVYTVYSTFRIQMETESLGTSSCIRNQLYA